MQTNFMGIGLETAAHTPPDAGDRKGGTVSARWISLDILSSLIFVFRSSPVKESSQRSIELKSGNY